MSEGFANPIIGGAAALIRSAIKSPNFVSGSAGWSINKDGSVEFNSGTFRGHIIGGDLFIYSGTPGIGNLLASDTKASTDPFGNATVPGQALYVFGGSSWTAIALAQNGSVPEFAFFVGGATQATAYVQVTGIHGSGAVSGGVAQWGAVNFGGVYFNAVPSANVPPTPGGGNLVYSDTSQTLHITGGVAVRPGTGTAQSLTVIGNSTGAGQLAYIEQDGTTDHALTVNLVGVGGTSQSAINAVSANSAFSCVEITGTETNRGTLKIAHKGYAAGSDSSAAGISIDLQTTVGGATGTAAQGLFITSTTDAIPGGNAITIRYNSSDWFVVKGNVGAGNGIVGIGVAIGHVPAGMLEIAQKDTTTIGLAMTAIAAGTDLVNLKDSGGAQRFQVNNAGNAIFRANTFFSTNAIIGSVSSDFGGAGSALTICHTTDPTTNPAAGHIILYVDATGHLIARGSAGTLTTLAGP